MGCEIRGNEIAFGTDAERVQVVDQPARAGVPSPVRMQPRTETRYVAQYRASVPCSLPVQHAVFGCMIHNLFDEYRFFPRYPSLCNSLCSRSPLPALPRANLARCPALSDLAVSRYPERELLITGKLFGSLIQQQLISSITLGIALRSVRPRIQQQKKDSNLYTLNKALSRPLRNQQQQRLKPSHSQYERCLVVQCTVRGTERRCTHSRYVLEALRKPLRSNMFKFGMSALEQFKQRLVEWPQVYEPPIRLRLLCEAPIRLRTCYAMSGTVIAYGGGCLRHVRTDGAYRAVCLRGFYAMSGTDLAYGATSTATTCSRSRTSARSVAMGLRVAAC
eukprot:2675854-Rhodomonas_salina.2